MKLRLVFMGTPAFGLPALAALHKVHDLVAVYCQPPQAAGRGMQLRKSAAQEWAEANNVPVYTPKSLRKAAVQQELAALAPDALVVASYGLILPQAVLDIPRLGCVNIHPSLLPRWRGAAPIQRAIEAQDTETGVCIMRMEAGLDTGPVWATRRMPMPARITASALHDELAQVGADLLIETLPAIANGAVATPQTEAGALYAEKISKEEGQLDFTQPATVLDAKVRAFTPWPGAWIISQGVRIKVHETAPGPASTAAPGTLLDIQGTIACGGGTSLLLQTVQREGKPKTDAPSFFRGFNIKTGERL